MRVSICGYINVLFYILMIDSVLHSVKYYHIHMHTLAKLPTQSWLYAKDQTLKTIFCVLIFASKMKSCQDKAMYSSIYVSLNTFTHILAGKPSLGDIGYLFAFHCPLL